MLTGALEEQLDEMDAEVLDTDVDESSIDVCVNPPRVSFNSESRLISAPLSSLFQAASQDSHREATIP